MSVVRNIRGFEFTTGWTVTVFTARPDIRIKISEQGSVTSEGKYIQTDFSNARLSFPQHQLIKHTDDKLFKKRLGDFYERVGVVPVQDVVEEFIGVLRNMDYPVPSNDSQERVWVIVPRPDKGRPTEKHMTFTNKFGSVINPDFETRSDRVMDVHMTSPGEDVTNIRFWMDIPDYIYLKCIECSNHEKRPQNNYILSSTLDGLRGRMHELGSLAEGVVTAVKDLDNSKKMLHIRFSAKETRNCDEYYGAYLGQEFRTMFNWSVVYEYKRSGLFKGQTSYYAYKKIKSGMSKDDGLVFDENGVSDLENKDVKVGLGHKLTGILLEWTQEREDFLKQLEVRFRSLNSDLNAFLSGIDENKLDLLITQNFKLLSE